MNIFARMGRAERLIALITKELQMSDATIQDLINEEQQIETDQAAEDQQIAANTADIATIQAALKAAVGVPPDQINMAFAALKRVDAKISAQTGQIATDDAATAAAPVAA